MYTILVRFAKDESGSTGIEYGLIAMLIGLAIVASATKLGETLNTFFSEVGTSLDEINADL